MDCCPRYCRAHPPRLSNFQPEVVERLVQFHSHGARRDPEYTRQRFTCGDGEPFEIARAHFRITRHGYQNARRAGSFDRRENPLPRCHDARSEIGEPEIWVVLREDRLERLAASCPPAGTNHAHPHPVSVSAPGKPHPCALTSERERGAANSRRAQRLSKCGSSHFIGSHAGYAETLHPSRRGVAIHLDVAKRFATAARPRARLAEPARRS